LQYSLDSITNKLKGFGFIEMSDEHQAKNAVDKLHGSFLLKNKIRVKMVYKI
jgi:RNA recognition motif-containing protein